MMVKFVLLFICLLKSIYPIQVNSKSIFCAQFGKETNEIGKSEEKNTFDPGADYPITIYIEGDYLYIGDFYNNRIVKHDLQKSTVADIIIDPEHQVFNSYMSLSEIVQVTKNGDMINSSGIVYKNSDKKWLKIRNIRGIDQIYHYNDILIAQKEFKFYQFDSTLTIVTEVRQGKGFQVIENNILYFEKEDAYLSSGILALENYLGSLKKNSGEGNGEKIPFKTRYLVSLIDYDKYYNSYWVEECDGYKDIYITYAFHIFNKNGKKIAFVDEPYPPEGWKYGTPLHVNKEGRIFRMLYHETDGIRVVEYLWKDALRKKKPGSGLVPEGKKDSAAVPSR